MRFLCWNMNYHIEHHMYPMVPFHQLPALHERGKHVLPQSDPSYTMALIRTLKAVYRQMWDPRYCDKPVLPGLRIGVAWTSAGPPAPQIEPRGRFWPEMQISTS